MISVDRVCINTAQYLQNATVDKESKMLRKFSFVIIVLILITRITESRPQFFTSVSGPLTKSPAFFAPYYPKDGTPQAMEALMTEIQQALENQLKIVFGPNDTGSMIAGTFA